MVPADIRLDVYRLCRSDPGPLGCFRQTGSRGDAEDMERDLFL